MGARNAPGELFRCLLVRETTMAVSRRDFLARCAWNVTAGGFAAGMLATYSATSLRRAAAATRRAADPYAAMDGLAMAKLIREGEVTPAELLEATIARIEQTNPQVNAVVTTCFEEARSRAESNQFEGKFAGVPLLVKDLDDVAGVRKTNGCRALLHYVPDETGAFVQACIDTGFNVAGKTNTPEVGLMGAAESLASGPGAARGRRWRREWCRSPRAATGAARCGFRRAAAGCSD